MNYRRLFFLLFALPFPLLSQGSPTRPTNQAAKPKGAAPAKPAVFVPTEQDVRKVNEAFISMKKDFDALEANAPGRVDCEVFVRALELAARFSPQELHTAKHVADALRVADLGRARISLAAKGEHPTEGRRGAVAFGFRSRIDDSVQAYTMTLPADWDATKPARLDLILHGRGDTTHETTFLAARDTTNAPPAGETLKLEVFARGNNAYRFSGETDVFEALADASRRFLVDPKRIVLRGFSMGGAGAWHLGLHRPGVWCAVEAGAGFVDTLGYARLTNLGPTELEVLPMIDALPVAANAAMFPLVGYGGEIDKQLSASVLIREALSAEGWTFRVNGLDREAEGRKALFLVGSNTPHRWHPASKATSDAFLDSAAQDGLADPDRVRHVTFTVAYGSSYWLSVDGMEKSYRKSEIVAERLDGGTRLRVTGSNFTHLSFRLPKVRRVEIEGSVVDVPTVRDGEGRFGLVKEGGAWRLAGEKDRDAVRKRPGLQGPIDDAFAARFLCVEPTAKPWNEATANLALGRLGTFRGEFSKWLRGEARVKKDVEVREIDVAESHLVLFGDPAGNRILSKIADRLPARWTEKTIEVGGRSFPAEGRLLVLICPNPLNPRKYVVLNSGHSIGEKEWKASNALQFARLGDWAVLKLEMTKEGARLETVEASGFFDERWR